MVWDDFLRNINDYTISIYRVNHNIIYFMFITIPSKKWSFLQFLMLWTYPSIYIFISIYALYIFIIFFVTKNPPKSTKIGGSSTGKWPFWDQIRGKSWLPDDLEPFCQTGPKNKRFGVVCSGENPIYLFINEKNRKSKNLFMFFGFPSKNPEFPSTSQNVYKRLKLLPNLHKITPKSQILRPFIQHFE